MHIQVILLVLFLVIGSIAHKTNKKNIYNSKCEAAICNFTHSFCGLEIGLQKELLDSEKLVTSKAST